MAFRCGAAVTVLVLLAASPGCTKAHDPPLPECVPPGGPEGALQAWGHWPAGTESLPLTVVAAESDRIRLEADPDRDYSDEGYLELNVAAFPEGARLPGVGDEGEALPWGVCASLAYTRLVAADGSILFEGGDPQCLTAADRSRWEPPPFFAVRVPADAPACLELGCPAEPREITVAADGVPSGIPLGQPVEIAIDGRPYLAEAQYARAVTPSAECGGGVDGGEAMTASVLLFPVRD